VAAGGLISYGGSITDSCGWRLHRTYSQGRQASPNCRSRKSTKVELIINLKTAKVIGLTVPPPLIALCRRGDRMKLLLRCMSLEVAQLRSAATSVILPLLNENRK
jgi:hypothetical protein